MARVFAALLLIISCFLTPSEAAEWYAAPDGKAEAAGTKDAPWDLSTALGGRKKIAPGDTLWLLPGTYKHPNRKQGSSGYEVRLAGTKYRPIEVRGMTGKRVTIDGGLTINAPSDYHSIRDMEILTSENFTMSRVLDEPGSHPKSYNRPWGGLNINAGRQCKYINLVIHDNAQGISLWSGATDTEIYGCIIYDNGWKAPDRGHGHAIYTQNQTGVKTIANCFMTGGYGYTVHAYGSERAYVDNYLLTENVCYNAGPFLVGGGRPSHNIRAIQNQLYRVSMQLGYAAPYNEDCEVHGNMIVGGDLTIQKFRKVVNEENKVFRGPSRDFSIRQAWSSINQYDDDRVHMAVWNPSREPRALVRFMGAKDGDRYRLFDPRDFYGKPVAETVVTSDHIFVRLTDEFAAFVLLKQP